MGQTHPDPADPAAKDLVTHGRIDVEGRIVEASNVTLFCTIELDGLTANAVYKPVAGERSLWDFPNGTLAGREVATYLISEAAGFACVPPTVLRDGPFGEGMVQLWVDTVGEELVDIRAPEELPDDWRVVLRAHDRYGEPAVLAHADSAGVRDLAVLDIIVNNTDRKAGHVLNAKNGRVYGVDHGICLHADPKLRTVLWGWIGEQLPDEAVARLRSLRAGVAGEVGTTLGSHLSRREVRSIVDRADQLLRQGVFPAPNDDWRAIPWPLF